MTPRPPAVVIFDDPPGKGLDEKAAALIVAWYRDRQAQRAEEADR